MQESAIIPENQTYGQSEHPAQVEPARRGQATVHLPYKAWHSLQQSQAPCPGASAW